MAFMSFQPIAKKMILNKEINLSTDTFKCFLAESIAGGFITSPHYNASTSYYDYSYCSRWNLLSGMATYGNFTSTPTSENFKTYELSVYGGYAGPKTVTWSVAQNDSLRRAEIQMSPVSWTAIAELGQINFAFVYDDTHQYKVVVAVIALSVPGVQTPTGFALGARGVGDTLSRTDGDIISGGETITISGCKVYL